MTRPLRFGLLGAARIAPFALIAPAREVDGVEVTAIAARDRTRAERFARKHGIGRVHDTYDALLADPSIDVVYNPLPNSHHAEWTIRALEAGKHVLAEKPLTANAAEAEAVHAVASRTRLVCMEAFHWRYHPLAARMLEILASGELGTVRRIETYLCVPHAVPGDIRYRLDLAGGAMMDTGCYTVSMLRHLAGKEPEVLSAKALTSSPGVDRRMEAELRFADGSTGSITTSLWSRTLLRPEAHVLADAGTMTAWNPILPQLYHHLTVDVGGTKRRERLARVTTYACQMRAFVGAVRHGTKLPTDTEDAVKNMRVIDAVYRVAGFEPRRGTLNVHPT